MKKILILLLTLLTVPAALRADEEADTARIYFRIGQSAIDPDYRDNASELLRFVSLVGKAVADSTLDRVVIHTSASPDGPVSLNERLCHERCESLSGYLASRCSIPSSLIESVADGVAWGRLREIVENDSAIPYREEILSALDTPLWIYDDKGNIVDGRKKRLMDLRGGRAFRYLYDNVFPDLRNGLAIHVNNYLPRTSADEIEVAVITATVLDKAVETTAEETSTGENSPASGTEPATASEPAIAKAGGSDPLHRLAIKTNLIYDALLMPNIEIGYRINDRWSVSAEADVAWWKNNPRHKYYQIMYLGGEGRYWFKTYKPWHGHFAGLFAGGGKYDLENGGKGYKGEGGMAGVSYGFMFPVSRSLSFEAEIGVGYLYTRYREYLPADGHYLFQRKSRTSYVGPLKAKFSLVWRLWDSSRKKGADR